MNRLPVQLKSAIRIIPTTNSTNNFSTTTYFNDKATNNRQGKILGKLFGNRVSGSKRRWFENPMNSTGQPTLDSPFNFNNPKKSDQGSLRRVNVLNKLFMTHITDLLATGQASEKILGKGLQITRVKVTPNFQFCNVYWMAKGDVNEIELEDELQKCGGILRHELSQLRLMGEVPRIHFVKDKTFANLATVETVLKTADFGDDHRQMDPSFEVKNDLYRVPEKVDSKLTVAAKDEDEEPLPEMRHDVFGVDRRAIMLRVLAKLKKSEQAWQQHKQAEMGETQSTVLEPEHMCTEKQDAINEKLELLKSDESFSKFIQAKKAEVRQKNKRRYRTPNEKYYRRVGEDDYDELDDGDYIEEDFDEKKK
ncbi:uncharacterized protein LOC129944669 isoform X3 [Eupeodes corollae]|nr:uncharacterized protein LOC129944669 isoform X3 [Eupeodes corollae]XP_055910243.1 uncharacterized protein LOC129944669 isoform X3 [Eupeodes corollae]XP_055910244.1 uncharacterized protein LOC129944669 isoform X3 [Eupeodes corollae]